MTNPTTTITPEDRDKVQLPELNVTEEDRIRAYTRWHESAMEHDDEPLIALLAESYAANRNLRESLAREEKLKKENEKFRADKITSLAGFDDFGDFPCGNEVIHDSSKYREDLGNGCSIGNCLYCRIEEAEAREAVKDRMLEEALQNLAASKKLYSQYRQESKEAFAEYEDEVSSLKAQLEAAELGNEHWKEIYEDLKAQLATAIATQKYPHTS